jgi:hypothetical protein
MSLPLQFALTAIASSALTLVAVRGADAARAAAGTVKLENARVRVSEIAYGPGSVRARGVRATDQVIVFLDDCQYRRLDPSSGETTVRDRKAGDVIWHDKGEDAPQLTNAGRPYRTLVIELK